MTFIRFLLRTLYVSLHVSMRMALILGVTLYSLYMIVLMLAEQEALLVILGMGIYLPLLTFLYLCAVRSGLVAIKATSAPSFGKLFKGAVRILRFHFMLSNLVISVIGTGGTLFVLSFTNILMIQMLSNSADRSILLDINVLINEFSTIPSLILIFPPLALSVAVGLMGTSLAATAAWAAENGPEHDLLWGITSQFKELFCVCALIFVTPAVLLMMSFGGPMSSIWNILFMSEITYAGLVIYSLWGIGAVAGAMALAYEQNLADIEAERQKQEKEMMGDVYDAQDIRALRLARQAEATIAAE